MGCICAMPVFPLCLMQICLFVVVLCCFGLF
jgi:hypothetical protein